MKLLSEEIKKIRKEHNLTQQELADRIYVTRQAISKWECDKAFPSPDVINKIKEEFSVNLNELISEEEVQSSIVNNSVEIKKLKKSTKVLLIICSALLVFVLFIIFMPSSKLIDIELRYQESENRIYASWYDGWSSYGIYIDDEFIRNINGGYYIIDMDIVKGDNGSVHIFKVETRKTLFKIKQFYEVEFVKVCNNKEFVNINELKDNNYYTDSQGKVTINFQTKLRGVYKLIVSSNDELIEINNVNLYASETTNENMVLYTYEEEYYLYLVGKLPSKYCDEDDDIHIPINKYTFSFSTNIPFSNLDVELVYEEIEINDHFTEVTHCFKTLSYENYVSHSILHQVAFECEVLNTIYKVNTSFDLDGKTINISSDNSISLFYVILFDANENVITYGTCNYNNSFIYTFENGQAMKNCIYIYIYFGGIGNSPYPYDIDFTFEISNPNY